MNEIWKDITGYEGLYKVSNYGRVKSLWYGKERIMKPTKDGRGYLYVCLYKNRKIKLLKIHRLVAQAFIPNPDNLPCINHKDEVKTNNYIGNLEFCSYQYNNTYGTAIQRRAKKLRNRSDLSKTVYQYSIDGDFIKVWQSVREVERQLGYACGNISRCCNGKCEQSYGYIWKYKAPE